MNREIHIVCSSVPWPLDNKKAIDSYNQLRVYYENNASVHLHYFCDHKNCHPTELNKYCVSINRYHPDEKNQLFENLNKDSVPVLLEGSNHELDVEILAGDGRRIVQRMYDCCICPGEERSSSSLLSKIPFLRREKTGQQDFHRDCQYFFAFRSDQVAASETQSRYVPILHGFDRVDADLGLGSFCLFHGDLSDEANEKAVLWLLERVFNDIHNPLIIAGRNPGKKIEKMAELYSHCCLVANPCSEEMNELVKKAQLHVLPSFGTRQPELKLIHSLHAGRHCIVNEAAVNGTGLEAACHIANNAAGFKSVILQLMYRPFEEEEIKLRENLFQSQDNQDFEKTLLAILSY